MKRIKLIPPVATSIWNKPALTAEIGGKINFIPTVLRMQFKDMRFIGEE